MNALPPPAERLLAAQASATAVIGLDHVVLAANPAYGHALGRPEDDLTGQAFFDLFPPNPEVAESGPRQLRQSWERVARTRHLDRLSMLRYDVPARGVDGGFETRFWISVSTPLLDGDQVTGIVHRIDDVTVLRTHLLETLSRAEAGEQGVTLSGASVATLATGLRELDGLASEVNQLRQALLTRSTIDQAKGLVMGDRRCGPDEAFRILVEMSNVTNVRLADVAAALVYRATHGSPPF